MKYDYYECVEDDVLNILTDYSSEEIKEMTSEENFDATQEKLYDELWAEDGITGNGWDGYPMKDDAKAEAVGANLELLADALDEFGSDAKCYRRALKDMDYADATIRCYVLGSAINSALKKMRDTVNQLPEA